MFQKRANYRIHSVSFDSLVTLVDLNDGKNFQLHHGMTQTIKFTELSPEGHVNLRVMKFLLPEGFVTDLASTVWPIPKLTRGNRAYVAHDKGYRVNIPPMSRLFWDLVMLKSLRQDGVPSYRAYTRYYAVRLGGWVPWNKYRKQEKGIYR